MANKRRPPRQRGGTFLGIVLGLIVGLAVAVVVALYITKTPTPFVEKTPPRPADNSPAAQAPDPNKSLQPRTPLPGAASGSTAPEAPSAAETSPLVPGNPVTPPTASAPTAPTAPATAPTKPSPADILNGKSTVPVAPPTTPPASTTDNASTGYYLQVGAFKSQTDAEQLRAKLALSGFEAKVTQRDANGLTLYRVRLGPYGKLDEMNHVRQRLQDGGYDTAVIRFTKQ